MRVLSLPLLLLAAACQQQSAPPARAQGASPPTAAHPASAAWTAAQEACVDQWLTAHALDAYGSPQGTMYPGGTPLFDEATGQRSTRQDFLAHRYPDVLRGCGVGP